MTDKQIMIDGVNVKDCKRRIGKDNYCRYYKRPCAENNFNCIWKKYLRKTQECEELKKQLTDFMNGEYCANGCAKMQTQYKEYHCKLIEQIDKLKALNEQAEQKLEKIKNRCNETLEITNKASGTNAYAGGRCTEAGQILQIIEEVE